MYTRILVPLDLSRGAEAVLPIVARLARAGQATVRLLHVAPEPRTVVMEGVVLAYADQEAERLRGEALDYLQGVAEQIAGLPVEFAVRFGDAAEEIIEEAIAWGADLIALATHARRGLSRVIAGSVADLVVRAAPCEVLVVRRREALAGEEVAQQEAPEAGASASGALAAAAGAAEPAEAARVRCLVCGQPSDDRICPACKAGIRGEALERKLEAEKAGRRGFLS